MHEDDNMLKIHFLSNRAIDLAFLLYSIPSESFIHQFMGKLHVQLENLVEEYTEFAKKNGLYSPRDGLPKFHYLCVSLLDSQGSVFPDVVRRYQKLVKPFSSIIEKLQKYYQTNNQLNDIIGIHELPKEKHSYLEKLQKIARIKFRLSEYSVFLISSLSGRFGMPSMVHDRYIFINAQQNDKEFIVEAVLHELSHQLLLGYRYLKENKFFSGHFLWQPRRAMMEEIVLACLEMEMCEDSKKREEMRERVLHLDEHLLFLKPFKPLFPKILYEWENNYMPARTLNLQEFIDHCVRKYLNPIKFILLMRHIKPQEVSKPIKNA